MSQITQTGNDNLASTGDNSPNIRGNNNKISLSNKQKLGWFTGGILLPVIAGIILEVIKQGNVSKIIGAFMSIFK